MRPTWFLRMARWARNPPSERQVMIGLAVLAGCLAIAGLEWLGWLPDWFSLDPMALKR